ncbi:calcium-binding protein (plasmid) [Phyllobacterium sp. 628]|uniref:calcium-binding protein n=1 Tax=Phyllobacterium sp. 628 TaxID=2718938 RepID=UPI0016625EF1|nr:calcium-binding protein [Phyllobacterium sp. 628]QND54446.1 calcium-binding protein [Phyllobacterium sp. 628]
MTKIVGTEGDDILAGTSQNDSILGLGGNDHIDGGAGNDSIYGGTGDDILTSSSGYDRLDGGEGNDRLELVGVGGAVTGGAGVDTLSINLSRLSAPVIFNGQQRHAIIGNGAASEQQIYFSDIEKLELTTGRGNDHITGLAGDDYIHAGDGYDTIIDTSGANRLFGGANNDSIFTTLSSAEIDGGSGDADLLYLSDSWRTEDVTVDFAQGTASTGVIIRGFENVNVELGSGNDTIIATNVSSSTLRGGEGNNHMEGSRGQDYMISGSGNDVMIGGDGYDIITSVGGTDLLIGGNGNDTIHDASLNATDGFTTIDAGAGDDLIQIYFPEGSIDGGDGIDTLAMYFQGITAPINFDAAAGIVDTTLTFSDVEIFKVESGSGNDTLRGGAYGDFLAGNVGDDFITGGAGNDELWGGTGADTMAGGDGADTFRYWSDTYFGTGIDHIEDFDVNSGDVLRIIGPATSTTRIHDFDSFMAASTQTPEGVYVAFNGSATYGILLENTTLSSFTANDLVFT